MIEFNLVEELYIRVVTMDANGMCSRLKAPATADPSVIASLAWKWATETAEMLKALEIFEWRIFIYLISLPDTAIERRIGPHNDFREPLLHYARRIGSRFHVNEREQQQRQLDPKSA